MQEPQRQGSLSTHSKLYYFSLKLPIIEAHPMIIYLIQPDLYSFMVESSGEHMENQYAQLVGET